MDNNFDWITPVTTLVSNGGFGALVWYLIVRHLPKIEETHRKEREDLDESHASERETWQDAMLKRDVESLRFMQELTKTLTEEKAAIEGIRSDLKAFSDRMESRRGTLD